MIRMSGCLAQDPGVKYGQQNHPEGMVLSGHVMTGRYHRGRLDPSSSRERPLRLALATLESNSLARTVVFGIKKKFFLIWFGLLLKALLKANNSLHKSCLRRMQRKEAKKIKGSFYP